MLFDVKITICDVNSYNFNIIFERPYENVQRPPHNETCSICLDKGRKPHKETVYNLECMKQIVHSL